MEERTAEKRVPVPSGEDRKATYDPPGTDLVEKHGNPFDPSDMAMEFGEVVEEEPTEGV